MKPSIKWTTVIITTLLTACIQEEALNAEADILHCILPTEILYTEEIDYSSPFNTDLNAYPIYIKVKEGTDLTTLAPKFELTPGATISPKNGIPQNFTKPVYYTVTSENKLWQRRYVLLVGYPEYKEIPTHYHFEHVEIYNNYNIFYEYTENGYKFYWASGNQGYVLTGNSKLPEDFPTIIDPQGYIGNCVRLTTKATGSLGEMVGKPIAAGNLFLGKFDITNALSDALSATQFGVAFYHRPILLTGFYKYKAGPLFYEAGNYTNQKDSFNIYALFYEKTEGQAFLNGHLSNNHFINPQMVALAQINRTETIESETWRYFEIPFDYESYHHSIDSNKLSNGAYYLSIVFSSSKNGDKFKGSPDSSLMIDEVQLIYE